MTKSGLLAGADVVFDPGVGAVAGLEELGGLGGSVGGHEFVAPAVDLFEQRQLRVRVRLLAPADDAHVGWPVRQLVAIGVLPEQGGQLNDPGLGQVAGLAVSVEDSGPDACGTRAMAARSRAPSSSRWSSAPCATVMR
jgi:hypothetical protein